MESQITFIGIIVSFIIAAALIGMINRRRFAQWLDTKLRKQFGQVPEKKMDLERYEKVPAYYVRHTSDFQIDDITWNDLDMDDIFHRIDSTQCAAGEEYLYYMLRSPRTSVADLSALPDEEAMLSWLEKDASASVRLALQKEFYRLGYTGKYSLYEYLDLLDTLGRRSNLLHIAAAILPAASFAVMFISTQVGIILLIASFCFNAITYFRDKREIEPFIISFRYVLRLIACAESISKISLPEAAPQQLASILAQLRESVRKFSGFRAGSNILFSGAGQGSGNPADIIMEYIRILFHLDLIKFNQMLSHVSAHAEDIDQLLGSVGRLDALISIASFRQSLPYYCAPDLVSIQDGEGVFSGQLEGFRNMSIHVADMYHPMTINPVPNSLDTSRPVLLTGSNASGKSTFLKATALCALLGQCIHTCPAREYAAPAFRIYSSMALRDSIRTQESYFMVEIRSLKRIVDETHRPVICFIDEVLRGTNTIERIAASSQILEALAQSGVWCFAATHDIELTGLLDKWYENYHFEEEIRDGDVIFSYQLHRGKASTRNAIRLLDAIGFPQSLTQKAQHRADLFDLTGTWR